MGGASLARPAEAITMLDVFRAVDSLDGGHLFDFHANSNPDCPVGGHIHEVLDGELADAQAALERRLAQATLADLLKRPELAHVEQRPRDGASTGCGILDGTLR